uniref:LITAF domain-containing protein n=1 Tax=Tetraselmis chuii TaxID=63592 RepID=A0A7S1X7S3_9CHLO|mmetsp:Transcript_38024/g.68194  ORF Transcript_38024/g.68194 Transcript_38024/m.68194 type:complete len:123 (+) Transcript_38024:187-555(+)|eukprot:CAMPEP_0177765486 /NCGR_PEP_ID=MMETSP0491_2-20121128/8018_1 /TAXON_ID=63592 /ORGANISM="Tetraselmis chuii, Strain PLY429" /LENGTH=122 /DNA_ID=CAMNT_0019281839 /DNA_START=175 /DNA_END=543 /DNA_ORIENTATION=-
MQPTPFPDLPVKPPSKAPKAGEVVIRYDVRDGKSGCCECGDLKPIGWVAVVLLLVFFFPFAWIPCCIRECHERYQEPVYGPQSATPHHNVPVGVPVGGSQTPWGAGAPQHGHPAGGGDLPRV